MRRDAKRDANEENLIDVFESMGCAVAKVNSDTGFPDLVVHVAPYQTALVEVKMPGERLTTKQKLFHASWPGRIHMAYTTTDAIEIVKFYRGEPWKKS